MPLDDEFLYCVAFVAKDDTSDSSNGRLITTGTAFLVGLPFNNGTQRMFIYAVTAGHLVSRQVPYYLRVNTTSGVEDVLTDEWVRHPIQDIAITSIEPKEDWIYRPVHIGMFADEDTRPNPRLGDRVYFIGLLGALRENKNENTPMVRSGTIGSFNQEDILVEWDNTQSRITAHLIDCRSYGGFSGSPCFVQAQVSEYVDMSKEIPGGMIGHVMVDKELLFGLISGHFDDKLKLKVEGNDSLTVRTRINSGVGLVSPVKFIKEMLYAEEFVTARQAFLDGLASDQGTG